MEKAELGKSEEKLNYRQRCYQSYVQTIWSQKHSLTMDEHMFSAKIYKKRFLAYLPKDKNALILDIGCGAGHWLYFLQKEGYKNSYGIDVSQEQLELAKQADVKNLRFADAFTYLKEKKETFDFISSFDVIEHLTKEEIVAFLDLIYAALKPGGQILVGTVNSGAPITGTEVAFIDFTHETFFSSQSLAQILQVCGFKNVEVKGESPVVHDVRGAIRSGLWWLTKQFLKSYAIISTGTGRGLWKKSNIYESRIYAIGKKEG